MSLRARIALLVGITVLIASAIGGIGTSFSSSQVGRNRLDQELLRDAKLFEAQNPQPEQLQLAFQARQGTCSATTPIVPPSLEGRPLAPPLGVDGIQPIGGDGIQQIGGDGLQIEPLPSVSAGGSRGSVPLGPDGSPLGPPPLGPDGSPLGPPRGGIRPIAPGLLPDFASSMQLVSPRGDAFAPCRDLPVTDVDRSIAAASSGRSFESVTVDGERFRVLTVGYEDIGAMQFARSLEITEDTLRSLLFRSVLFGLTGAALAATFGWIFADRAIRPLQRLSGAAERVAQTQDLGERIYAESDDEVGALANSFNTMMASLATSREQQNRLVQDASHELRTPLTSIRTNLELLQRHREIEASVRTEILTDMSNELGELTRLTAEVVESATEVPTDLQLREEVDLVEVVEGCIDQASRRHHRNIVLVDSGRDGGCVLGDRSLIERAVTNLLNNAAKFSDGAIEVVVSGGMVAVRDRGPGIPESDLPHIFDRFYRSTAARSAPGSGLGLAIVRQIVIGHGGKVIALNRDGGGAEICFELPELN